MSKSFKKIFLKVNILFLFSEISSAQNHRYNNAPSPDDDIMNGMEKEEVVSAVVRVKS